MKRLISQGEIKKKQQRSMLIKSIFMLVILVLGTVGYGFLSSTKNSQKEQEIQEKRVKNVGNQWVASIEGQTYIFSNSPESVQDIPVPINITLYNYAGSPLYIVSGNQAISYEIASTLGRFSARTPQEACYGSCEEDLPEKNCTENLIIWSDSPENNIFQEESCIFIEGDLRTVDAFLYKILEIS